jgi:hypothetical protein
MSQPLSAVCNVAVYISPVTPATPTFNQALIVGSSTVIPTATRVRQYSSTAAMLSDGFTSSSPEFLAAQIYFDQTPTPSTVWIGRQDLTVPESALTALQACRTASPNWWACTVLGSSTSDHEAIAPWIQSAGQGMYFYTTSDAAVLAGTAGNVMSVLQTGSYNRVFGIYSTTQSGAAPNNAYASAAAMGVAMGLNTYLANSNFTMSLKTLVGITPEPTISQTQVAAIQALNGNVYTSTAGVFQWLSNGVVANGQFMDEVLNLDMLASDIQYSCIGLLVSAPSVPLTDAGEHQFLAVVSQCAERSVTRGFIAPGTWTGQTVLGLSAGTPLPKGYMVQAQSYTNQATSDRQARKAMPVYLNFVEAGCTHSLTVGVYVQR